MKNLYKSKLIVSRANDPIEKYKTTEQIAVKQPPLIPITRIRIDKTEEVEKVIDVQTHYENANNFDLTPILDILVILVESIHRVVSTQISNRDGNHDLQEQS